MTKVTVVSTTFWNITSEVSIMQSEEQRIMEEVKKRKERARQSGVITSAFKLYRDNLRYYEAWATNCPDVVHPEIKVTKTVKASGPSGSDELRDATIRGHDYFFKFRERSTCLPDGELFVHGYLEVDFQGQRVMTIDCGCDRDEYMGSTWYTGDVSAFIEGPWMHELNSVFVEVTHLHEEYDKRRKEQYKYEEVEKLKKNFGL